MADYPGAPAVVYRSSPRTRRILIGVWALVMLMPGILVAVGLLGGDGASLAAGLITGLIISNDSTPQWGGYARHVQGWDDPCAGERNASATT